MTSCCRGICQFHRIDALQPKDKYKKGQKRCTYCGIFLETKDNRCPCCRSILRTKSRQTRNEFRY